MRSGKSPADLTEALFAAALGALALLGLRTTYAGWSFLLVGLAGLALGLAVGYLGNALRQPVIVVAAVAVVAFFLFGGWLVAPDQATLGVLPNPHTVVTQSRASVYAWKELLTVLPPVDGADGLLAVPYILGLVGGAAGLTVARRIRWAPAPVIVPAVTLGIALALGTRQPAASLPDGVLFAALALCWAALRGHRRPASVRAGAGRLTRALAAGGVLVVAGAAAALAGPWLPGAAAGRVVLRDHVTPPFDLRAYPSPLVGFRKYTKDANELWDQTLFTVTGLPAGATVRIATLDNYDGSVWGATNGTAGDSFQRAGSRIGAGTPGRETTLRITIAPAYASANDVNAWLPDAGNVIGLDFGGVRRAALADSFRYNLATSTGIVTARLGAGDSYTVRTVLTNPTVPEDAQPFGPSTLNGNWQSFFGSRIGLWTKGAVGIGAQVRAIATYLRDHGAYSDGGPGETQYLPGHSIGRLSAFLNADRPVGDDEQYAAAFALIANGLGMPTRVVLGARPAADGVVRGSDVHAWVEVHLADGSWAPIPTKDFMPDTSKKPDQQPPQEVENANAAVVPPPNASRLTTTTMDTNSADSRSRPPGSKPRPGWLVLLQVVLAVATWAGPPVLAVLLVVGSILGLKARRRRRRRTLGSTANRFAAGWYELVDYARDLGITVPAGRTRRQQAELLIQHGVAGLAEDADASVYGPGDPTEEQAAAYWRRIDETRRGMGRDLSRWRRIRAELSLRSLRRRAPAPALRGVVK